MAVSSRVTRERVFARGRWPRACHHTRVSPRHQVPHQTRLRLLSFAAVSPPLPSPLLSSSKQPVVGRRGALVTVHKLFATSGQAADARGALSRCVFSSSQLRKPEMTWVAQAVGGAAVIGQAFPEDVSRGQSRLTNAGVLDRPSESLGDGSGFPGSLLVELKTGTN